MLTTQTALQMSMKGYPCEQINCRFEVLNDDGEKKSVQVQRYLIQLGFGPQVTMQPVGECIDIPRTMLKVVVKLRSSFRLDAGHHSRQHCLKPVVSTR